MKKSYILFLVSLFCLIGCSEKYEKQEFFDIDMGTEILYIYGYSGQKYNVYLGKLNASRYDGESIWNSYGKYGNKYNSNSIWNKYGTYGNKYNSNSPFNSYGSNPPKLVDKNGNFYGYFTANKSKSQRANFDLVNFVCDNYESIGEDVSGWYDKIFY